METLLMTIRQFIRSTNKYLLNNSDIKRAEKEKDYLYSDLKHYGVDTPTRKKWVSQNRKYLKELTKKDMLEHVRELWDQPSFEERALALDMLNMHIEQFDKSDMPLIEKMMRESRGWALLDGLIIPVMPVILEKDTSAYSYLKKWIKDDDFWVRRSALLAQLQFFRYDNGGDRDLFFQLAKSQFDESWIDEIYTDRETIKRARFFIRKAIGWTLREMSAKQPEVVYKFIKENKADMSGLSFREGSRKLPEKFQKLLNN